MAPLFCTVRSSFDSKSKRYKPYTWFDTKKNVLCIQVELIESTSQMLTQMFALLNSNGDFALIQFPGILLAGFRGTLEGLQKIWSTNHLRFGARLIPGKRNLNDGDSRPKYTKTGGFSFALNDDGTLRYAPGDSLNASTISTNTGLDHAQARAVLHALSNDIALIQGPPGTGKSYTGVKIAKILLAAQRHAKLGPLLIVCYTNHALDQFLEHLLDAGVDNLVRVGTRSKSKRLEKLTLSYLAEQRLEQIRNGHVPKHTTEPDSDAAELKQVSSELNTLLEALPHWKTQKSLKHYLNLKHPDAYKVIYENDDSSEDEEVSAHDSRTWIAEGPEDKLGRDTFSVHELESRFATDHETYTRDERGELCAHWSDQYRAILQRQISQRTVRLNKAAKSHRSQQDDVRIEIMKNASVIGVTTTALGYIEWMITAIGSKVLLCEEAGEVLEAHVLTTLLPTIDHAIFLGDHQQLRPHLSRYDLTSECRQGKPYSFDRSLFERLVEGDDWHGTLPYVRLQTQRRMHPSISRLIRPLYPDLEDAESVTKYPEVVGMRRRLFWYDHDQREESGISANGSSTSKSNLYEVEMAHALVKYIVQQTTYGPEDIAVLTPYLGQLTKIQTRLKKSFAVVVDDRDETALVKEGLDGGKEVRNLVALATNATTTSSTGKTSLDKAIRVATIDNFQGEEAKVIIISLVRCNSHNQIGFLKTDNRINVLLSRAKHGMYIIGNTATARSAPMLAGVYNKLKKDGNVGDAFELVCPRHSTAALARRPEDFAKVSPAGGCGRLCDRDLPCGHRCPDKCHSEGLHNAVDCREPCERKPGGCTLHKCPLRCGQTCPDKCNVKESVTLDCGHTDKYPCWQIRPTSTADKIVCKRDVERTFRCGHRVAAACGAPDTDCPLVCVGYSCGHACKRTCGDILRMADCKNEDELAAFTRARLCDDCGQVQHGHVHEFEDDS